MKLTSTDKKNLKIGLTVGFMIAFLQAMYSLAKSCSVLFLQSLPTLAIDPLSTLIAVVVLIIGSMYMMYVFNKL